MKCEKCGYAYVKNIGTKERVHIKDKVGKTEKGDSGGPLLTHNNEKKYFCKNCGAI